MLVSVLCSNKVGIFNGILCATVGCVVWSWQGCVSGVADPLPNDALTEFVKATKTSISLVPRPSF